MRPWSPIPNALILDARARRIREGRPACEVLALAELLALDAQRQEQTQQGVAVPPVSLRVVAADLGWGRGRLKAALEAYSALGHAFAWIGADQSRTTCGPVADQSRTTQGQIRPLRTPRKRRLPRRFRLALARARGRYLRLR